MADTATGTGGAVLTARAVRLGLRATDKWDAIRQSGDLLREIGAVEDPYPASMRERERSISTYLGEGFAIPHGTDEARRHVLRTALGFLQFPDGVDWDGNRVDVCVAIAADGDEHIHVLSALAKILMDHEAAEKLRRAEDVDTVLALLTTHRKDPTA
ncbi:MAG TPA: PTS sugar transporter subunit IIA [Pseudonocardiaceae bacterium]